MARPIAYDITHLAHRLNFPAPSGIEKVDLAYARHFGQATAKLCAGVHYGFARPLLSDPCEIERLVRVVEGRWAEDVPLDRDATFQATRSWLIGKGVPDVTAAARPKSSLREAALNGRALLRRAVPPLFQDRRRELPEGAIYLNVGQHAFEFPRQFAWLGKRRDLQRVFFMHDLLPLDFPEFWPAGHEKRFQRRLDCFVQHATALITTSRYVEERARATLRAQGRQDIPIFSSPFPSPLSLHALSAAADRALEDTPYFVAVNTLEPRKNHLLLLNIWRDLVQSGAPVPKLVLVGKRGWEYEQIVGMIERSRHLRGHVVEVAGLSNAGLNALISHANALLMPSFAEGFGLAIVEALGLGTPVVASDIPVFREASQGCALFHHPLDGLGWRQTVLDLAADTARARDARALTRDFVPVSGEAYFAKVEAFLASL